MNRVDVISHEQARELLPWLVNGSLAADEHDRVRDHATSCVICRQELAALERLRESIVSTTDQNAIPAPDMRRINARIDVLIAKERRGEHLMQALRNFFRSPWRMAFAAQTALLTVLLGLVLWPEPEPVEFTTLTTPDTLPAGDYIRVVFDPDLDAAGVAAVLENAGLEIVAGPSERGVATLRPKTSASPESREAALRRLFEETGVLFAAPVQSKAQ